MSNKKEGITEIQKLADKLRKEDGVKKNGTSDVDSRYVLENENLYPGVLFQKLVDRACSVTYVLCFYTGGMMSTSIGAR